GGGGRVAAGGGGGRGRVATAAATSAAATPAISAAALAASAFWMLWSPRSAPTPARSAKAPSGPVHGARLIKRLSCAYQPSATCERTDSTSTQLRLASLSRSAMSALQSSSLPIAGRLAASTRRAFREA